MPVENEAGSIMIGFQFLSAGGTGNKVRQIKFSIREQGPDQLSQGIVKGLDVPAA